MCVITGCYGNITGCYGNRLIMTELVDTEQEYVKKLRHVCEVSSEALLIVIVTAAAHW